ncbi:YDG domain-containing protein [Coprococcus sp. CLA-AA-H212]|uniref:YDG domain-containing protein n=2 Tax=Coprococcus hominis (ex Arizal et al. 2022) TaxID=2881262 RepID=A0ABS8FM41_9FIRM|nr:YDG domain-containing protein [Coprococcus hominis (ex Arizal et al. 2022)]
MRKREGMKKRRSRILAWLLACLMVLSVIQGTGWGSLTVQAEEEVNIPTTLSVGNNDIITKGIVSETTEGDGWSYNADTNTLTLTNANLGSITYDGGDLNLQISGENTVGQIDAENSDAAYITGIENGTDKAKLYCGGFISVDALTINNIELNVEGDIDKGGSDRRTVSLENVKLYVKGHIDANIISCSGSQINTEDRVFVGGSLNCVDSEIRAGKIDFSAIKRTYTNSIVVDNSSNTTRIYGAATLCEDLTIPSTGTIMFAEGASITNLDKLTVEEDAKIFVNYKMDEYGSESYEKHTHNTEATKGGTYIDSQKHYENVACKDCPIGYVTETKVEREHTYENGFCKACDAYEPAVLNSNNAYEIGNAGQLYWFADKVNKERYKYVNAKAVLTADIVVNKNVLNDGDLTKDVDGLRDWTPIQQYGGTFDGAQHTISGIYCVSDTIDEAGIFQNTIDNAIVENIGVLDSYYCLKEGYNVGGIVGFNSGIIRNCYNEGMVSSLYNNDNYLGGICGMNGGGTITGCYNKGKVANSVWGTRAGGICGRSTNKILNCYNTGSVTGGYMVGGICGSNASSTTSGRIENCYNIGTINTIINDNDDKRNIAVIENEKAVVNNCYYLEDNYIAEEDGASGRDADDFASGEIAYRLQVGQDDPVWGQTLADEGGDPYPVLGGKTVYQNVTYSGCTVDTSLTIEYSNEEKDIKFTHALVKSEKVNADCEKDGMEAYWTCTSCQRRFSDEDGTKELNKLPVISAFGHDYKVDEEKSEDGTRATLIFTCQREGCTADKHEVTVTLTAPDSLTYAGTAKEATVTQTPKDAFDSVSVSYESVDKRRSATLVEGKPVNAGDYKATVTVGTGEDAVSASVEYTIQKKEISVYSIDASDKIYDGATKVKVSRVTLIGILEQDVVEADTTDLYGDLPDKNAGTYTEITLPELKLVGDSANNYELTQPDNPMKLNVSVSVQKAPKAPNMPGASMEVDYTKTTVGAVTLPAGWKFDDADIDKKLDVDVPVTVTAKYADEDAGNYEVESVEITLTRKACMHPTIKWIVDKEATVDAEGSRHKECTVCNTVLATETIAKLKAQTPDVTIRYTTHVQTYGWQGDENNANKWFANGKMAGTSGKAKRLEGIKIRVYWNDNLGIQYTTHCQSYGWLPWSANGEMNGTEGEAKRLEAIKIQLTGADKEKYDVYYRVHAQSYGWLAWAANGAPAGTAGLAKRLEAIQIVIVKKGESFDHAIGNIQSARGEAYIASSTANANPVVTGENNVNVEYRTHVQSFGWQGWKYNGVMSGTSGKAKRLEGINIKLTNKPYSGNIVYTTHVQSIGWQGNENNVNTWFRDGQMAGTSGRAKRLEAIRIALTGEMAEHYDVYYRVHAQTYGWLAWAKNGEAAGTAGLSKRLEGIQIVLVPKGGAAPANNYGGVVTTNKQTYIKK